MRAHRHTQTRALPAYTQNVCHKHTHTCSTHTHTRTQTYIHTHTYTRTHRSASQAPSERTPRRSTGREVRGQRNGSTRSRQQHEQQQQASISALHGGSEAECNDLAVGTGELCGVCVCACVCVCVCVCVCACVRVCVRVCVRE